MNNTTKKENKQYIFGYDYDGTSDHIPMAPNSVVITGRTKKDEKELRKVVGNVPIYFFPDNQVHNDKNVGMFKGQITKELGLKTFYEDTDEQAPFIREVNPNVKVVDVDDQDMTYVIFTSEGTGLPIAHHLQNEGYTVYVGQAETFKELGIESTPDEDKKLKDSQVLYKDIIKNKTTAQKLLKALEKVKNKDEYFIFCDLNSLYTYGERLLKAGFTKGIFPTKKDYDFEKGREQAMEFVEKNYPDIKIIPFQKVKTVEDAKKIVSQSEVPMVIQSEGDFVSTICPVDDVESNKTEILSALDKHAQEYAKGEIILKEKLVQPIEITPQIVFWNGEPVFTDIDIETKNIGDGENNGNQVGCGSNLIIKTDLKDKINEIAFPPIVYKMAKEHKGIFVWDISIYITEKGLFFGEFCSNRFGYDAILTEMSMSGGAGAYFKAIQSLKNPLKKVFGTAVRVFNLKNQKDTEITVSDLENTWLYEVKNAKGKWESLGVFWDLAVITGAANTVEGATEKMYDNLLNLSFKEKYARTKDDFLKDYPTSIMRRFIQTNGEYYKVQGLDETKVIDDSEKIQKLSSRVESGIEEIKLKIDELSSISKETTATKTKIRDRVKSILNAKR